MFLILAIISLSSQAKLVSYEFDIHTKQVSIAGKTSEALAIKNQIPGPLIQARVGDTLQVTFNNRMSKETSIHWHGVLLPNDQDGVPYLTTDPILPYSKLTYQFRVSHSGTYWYHAHTGLQEQRGLYGPLVFHPKKAKYNKSYDKTIVLSDWTHENPNTVYSNLKKSDDWYALKKNNVVSWYRILGGGFAAIKKRFVGSLMRMGPMDISDVAYDAFLINGKETSQLNTRRKTLKLRLINASASTYFYVEFAGSNMQVIAADGVNIKPFFTTRLRVAIAETYDVIVRRPKRQSYELRATAEDVSGHASLFLGQGKQVQAQDVPKPDILAGHKKDPYNYKRLKALENTNYGEPDRTVQLDLTGSMRNFVWSFNNKTLKESDKIMIKKGEVVRFVLNNKTMMHHPLHLHGHFFRVLNGQGDYSPLKHTVNVPPHDKVEIEFLASEEKDWFFHCHNLYHMKAGMSRVISYQETSPERKNLLRQISSDSIFSRRDIYLLSQMMRTEMKFFNTRNAIELEYDSDYKFNYHFRGIYLRSLTDFFSVYAGFSKQKRTSFQPVIGLQYTLPFLIELDAEWQVYSKKYLVELESEFQLSDRLKLEGMVNTDKEYRLSLSYEITKNLLLSTMYHSHFKHGAGLRFFF